MNKKLNWETEKFDTSYLCSNAYGFKLIENEIDIQAIEGIEQCGCNIQVGNGLVSTTLVEDILILQINKLTRAIKQLDNKISNLQSN